MGAVTTMQVIDYLSENGYLRDEWRPIETAPKNCENILVYRPVYVAAIMHWPIHQKIARIFWCIGQCMIAATYL